MSAFETLRFDIDGPVATIRLDRPRVLNAMNSLCLEECAAALRLAEADAQIRALVIGSTSARAFTSGADISEIAGYGREAMGGYNARWIAWFAALEASRLPVIASVDGWATGGGTEMTLACDFVVAAESARFGLAEINIGVIPGAGAAVRLTRWLGRLRAKEILMLGEAIPARQALAWDLVNAVTAADELETATLALAAKLATKAPLALAAAKRCVNVAAEAALPTAIDHALAEFRMLFASEDQKEGMAAFLEKRPARFTGR